MVGHFSGSPLSVFRWRAGSVTAGRSFSQIASGSSSSPIVLPSDFYIFDCPSSPTIRRVGVRRACGSGK